MRRVVVYVLIALCVMAAVAVRELPEDKGAGAAEALPAEADSAVGGVTVLARVADAGDEIMLARAGYTVSYNKRTMQPNWVGWRLTASRVDGPWKRSGIKFQEDAEVPEPRATDADYRGSGYDRGHMCPSGDNRWSREAQLQSFLFTNICPQSHGLNAGDWNEMEQQCRKWAESEGEIYIVCGPIFYAGSRHRRIGRNRIPVPEAFFKVVLSLRGTPKAIGFIYKNRQGNRPKGDYVNTVDQVERIAGIDFFPSLPDAVENKVEAESDLAEWGR